MSSRPVALISGGSRGLGAALVEACFEMECRVATFSRSETTFVANLLRDPERRDDFLWELVDARDNAAVKAFVANAVARFGRIDLLVNNAAIGVDGVLPTMREQDIAAAVDVNLTSVLMLSQACSRVMLRQRSGCIISISSVNAIRGHSGVSVYSATKGALDAFTRSLARELGPRNIRVNAVAPGYFESAMVGPMEEAEKARICRRTPLRRLACVQDITHAVQFLASDDAAFITGQTLVVDGGITC
jgi:3-oxoacyl-[acyl-carrier protein] reductase